MNSDGYSRMRLNTNDLELGEIGCEWLHSWGFDPTGCLVRLGGIRPDSIPWSVE